jgi:hypothetical protein
MVTTHQQVLAIENAKQQKEKLSLILRRFCNRIACQQEYAVWVFRSNTEDEARRNATKIFGLLHYDDDMAPNETAQLYGLVGADMELIRLGHEVNQAKASFQEAMEKLRMTYLPDKPSAAQKKKALRKSIGLLQEPRFNYRQAIRRLKILDNTPRYLHFTWLRTHDVRRITREKAINALVQMGSTNSPEYKLLASLSAGEVLAKINATPQDVHLNVCYHNGERKAIRVNTPVIVPLGKGEAFPDFKPLIPLEEMPKKHHRAGRKTENTPIIAGSCFYRYLEEHRKYESSRA